MDPPNAALCCIAAEQASAEPRGRAQGSEHPAPFGCKVMRTVAAVIALVACVQAGLWALAQDHLSAPNFEGQLASVSYAPFGGTAHPDSGTQAQAAQIRADLQLLAPLTRAIRTYSSTGGVELVPGIAAEFGLRVTIGAWIDKHKDRNEREIRSVIDLAKRHSNVNGIIVGNETIYRGEQKVTDLIHDDPAGQALDQRAGHHRRNLARLDRASRAGLGGRLHRRAHPALLGRLLRQAERRSGDPDLRQAAAGLSRQAHRHRRVRLAERGLQSQSRRSRPHRAGASCCATSSRAPKPMASTTTSSKRSTSRGRSSKAASVPIGACSTPRASRNSTGPARSAIPITGSSPASRLLVSVLLSLPILAMSAVTLRQVGHAGRRRQCGRRLVRRRVRLLERTLFRARRRLRARPRRRIADPADHHRAGAHR